MFDFDLKWRFYLNCEMKMWNQSEWHNINSLNKIRKMKSTTTIKSFFVFESVKKSKNDVESTKKIIDSNLFVSVKVESTKKIIDSNLFVFVAIESTKKIIDLNLFFFCRWRVFFLFWILFSIEFVAIESAIEIEENDREYYWTENRNSQKIDSDHEKSKNHDDQSRVYEKRNQYSSHQMKWDDCESDKQV